MFSKEVRTTPIKAPIIKRDTIEDWRQAAQVEAGLRREFKARAEKAEEEIERLQAALEDAVETLEAMDLAEDNPLYDRLRAALEPTHR